MIHELLGRPGVSSRCLCGLRHSQVKRTQSKNMMNHFCGFAKDESAVTSIEYALFAALIAAVIFVAVGNAGSALGSLYGYVSNCVDAATSGSFGQGC